MQTLFHDKNNLLREFSELSKELIKSLDHISEEFITSVDGKILEQSLLQFFFKKTPESPAKSALLDLVLRYALLSEKSCPGSFAETIRKIAQNCSLFVNGNHDFNFENFSEMVCRHPQKKDFYDLVILPAQEKDPLVAKILERSFLLAGFDGKIFIEKTPSATFSVELVNGFTFNIEPGWSSSIKLLNPRIICIDGYVESVSEIHHLLQSFSETKETALLVTRGLSDDVLHTLKVNWERGALKIFPVKSPFDLEGINTLADISTVVGGDVVSSLKGNLISSIDLSILPMVNEVSLFDKKMTIRISQRSKRVDEHISNLKKRRDDSQHEDTSDLLNKRIKSLSPSQVIIRIPEGRDFIKKTGLIDHSIRLFSFLVQNGIPIKKEERISDTISSFFCNKFYKSFSDIGFLIL